jgi:hypothetical protein
MKPGYQHGTDCLSRIGDEGSAMLVMARGYGGYGACGASQRTGDPALRPRAAKICDCSHASGIHRHDHAAAWSHPLPTRDPRSFWGALGCACRAV